MEQKNRSRTRGSFKRSRGRNAGSRGRNGNEHAELNFQSGQAPLQKVLGGSSSASWRSGLEQRSADTAAIFRGRCKEMCPEKERFERERYGELSEFEVVAEEKEIDAGRKGQWKWVRKTDSSHAVKKFRRSAAGSETLQSENVRDFATLHRTGQYLVHELLQRETTKMDGWRENDVTRHLDRLYAFLSDRFRAIRQDYTVQQAACREYAVHLEKQIAVLCFLFIRLQHFTGPELAGEQLNFNARLCHEQIAQCFTPLLELYDAGLGGTFESEFRACYWLFCVREESIAASMIGASRSYLPVGMALVKAWRRGDVRRFLSIESHLRNEHPVLHIFHRALSGEMVARGFDQFNIAFSKREPMTIKRMTYLLGFHDGEAIVAEVGRECGMVEEENNSLGFKLETFSSEKVRAWTQSSGVNLGLSPALAVEVTNKIDSVL